MSERLEPQNFRKDGSLGFGEVGVPRLGNFEKLGNVLLAEGSLALEQGKNNFDFEGYPVCPNQAIDINKKRFTGTSVPPGIQLLLVCVLVCFNRLPCQFLRSNFVPFPPSFVPMASVTAWYFRSSRIKHLEYISGILIT